jgi:hypothetical protein
MTVLAACCSLLGSATAIALLLRLQSVARSSKSTLASSSSPDDFPERVWRLVSASVDAGLLVHSGPGGLADVAVRAREPQDSYRSVAELIDWLGRTAGASSFADVSSLIKGVYQLGHVLRASEEAVRACLEPLLSRIQGATVGGTAVARVECVRPGALLDPGTMAPVNYGARVTQPLGILAYDAAGKLLGKAKVLCG